MTRRTPLSILFLFLAAFAVFAQTAQQPQSQNPPANVAARKNVVIPMRDGVRLAADVYLPAKDSVAISGKYPAILSRTPYNKEAAGTVREAIWFAQHGYAVVMNDVRGRFHS